MKHASVACDFCRVTATIRGTGYQFFTDQPNSRKNPNDRRTATMTLAIHPTPALPPDTARFPRDAQLMAKAKELEAAFLAEMLGQAGMDADAASSFGGGAGEEQFASFLRQEQARLMVERGGIGLAESLFRALGGATDHG